MIHISAIHSALLIFGTQKMYVPNLFIDTLLGFQNSKYFEKLWWWWRHNVKSEKTVFWAIDDVFSEFVCSGHKIAWVVQREFLVHQKRRRRHFCFRPASCMTSCPFPEAAMAPAPHMMDQKLSPCIRSVVWEVPISPGRPISWAGDRQMDEWGHHLRTWWRVCLILKLYETVANCCTVQSHSRREPNAVLPYIGWAGGAT